MEPHLAPPPEFVAQQTHLVGSSAYWLVPRPFELTVEAMATTNAVKLLVTDGRACIEQHGRRAHLTPRSFAWLDPDAPHCLSVERGRVMILRFSRPSLRKLHPLLDVTPALVRGLEQGEALAAGLFHEVLVAGPQLTSAQVQAAANSVIASLGLCQQRPSSSRLERHVALAVADVAELGRDPRLSATELAQRRGVSRRFLDQAFLRVLGVTPAEFIRDHRLEGAARDLAHASVDTSVADIASRWGFDDASHFGRAFRRRYACTPHTYRTKSNAKS